jgi:heme-degrading monooxygenase HmoA
MPASPLWLLMLVSLLTLLGGCYAGPWRHGEASSADPPESFLVILSEVEIAPGERKAFFRDTRRVLQSLSTQPGLVGYRVRFQLFGSRAWTMTVWEREEDAARFAATPAHLEAMRDSGRTLARLRFARTWRAVEAGPLSWREAFAWLEAHPLRAAGGQALKSSVSEPPP